MKTYSDIRKELNVSDATISNWIKTGVIPRCSGDDGFDSKTYDSIIKEIRQTQNKLHHRANRQGNYSDSCCSTIAFSEKSRLIIKKLRDVFDNDSYSLSNIVCIVSIIILERENFIKCRIGIKNLNINSKNKVFTAFLNAWLKEFDDSAASLYRRLIIFDFPDNELDFIGALYESLRTVSDKSIFGAYYTPAILTQGIELPENASVIDPCAGTGTMLLSILSLKHNPSKIVLRDIDKTALRIAKINFVLFFKSVSQLVNTEVCDILQPTEKKRKKFDFIITNPPYGAKFTAERKKELICDFPNLATSESFSIALYQSLQMIKKTGKIYFILPESILYVATHVNIRKQIFSKQNSVKIIHYAKAFKGVMSPIIRIEIQKSGANFIVERNGVELEFSHLTNQKNQYRPPFVTTVEEVVMLEKIQACSSFTLEGKCKFGIGVVTGNNQKHLITDLSLAKNNTEAIYTGKELQKFIFKENKYYIEYNPKILQQTAPLKQYRAPKICYRFISDSLVACLDENGKLILNSINFFYPNSSHISPKAICAFLNSSVATFIYQKMFNSTKVLRSHIEMIPIPNSFYQNTKKLEDIYNRGASGENVVDELNKLCYLLYNL